MYTELAEDPLQVVLDRFGRDAQMLGDRLGRSVNRQRPEDVAFPFQQRRPARSARPMASRRRTAAEAKDTVNNQEASSRSSSLSSAFAMLSTPFGAEQSLRRASSS